MILFFLASGISIRFGFSLSRPSFLVSIKIFSMIFGWRDISWLLRHFPDHEWYGRWWKIRQRELFSIHETFSNQSDFFIVLPSTTISCLWFPEVLDNSERLLYLTRCHLLLRPRWMGSESHLMPFFVFEPNWHFLLWRQHRSSQD